LVEKTVRKAVRKAYKKVLASEEARMKMSEEEAHQAD
jgi:hypothetical protein